MSEICVVIKGGIQPLRFSAVKSRMGHAEPAAGGLGIANLATMLGSSTIRPLTFLRQACANPTSPFSKLSETTRRIYEFSSLSFHMFPIHIAL